MNRLVTSAHSWNFSWYYQDTEHHGCSCACQQLSMFDVSSPFWVSTTAVHHLSCSSSCRSCMCFHKSSWFSQWPFGSFVLTTCGLSIGCKPICSQLVLILVFPTPNPTPSGVLLARWFAYKTRIKHIVDIVCESFMHIDHQSKSGGRTRSRGDSTRFALKFVSNIIVQ